MTKNHYVFTASGRYFNSALSLGLLRQQQQATMIMTITNRPPPPPAATGITHANNKNNSENHLTHALNFLTMLTRSQWTRPNNEVMTWIPWCHELNFSYLAEQYCWRGGSGWTRCSTDRSHSSRQAPPPRRRWGTPRPDSPAPCPHTYSLYRKKKKNIENWLTR